MNWNVLGHEWAVNLLRHHVVEASYRQAYLFTGPQGVGRRTLALHFAQALNCTQPLAPGEPCGECRVCVQTYQMSHPDIAIVQAEEVGGTLRVNQIRELQHSLSLAPYEARHRVAILLRFEEAHISASNALLKTLEEPPERVVLILTASDAEVLLPTIVSRCEIIRLRPLSLHATAEGLHHHWEIPETKARLLAHISGGRPGYALQLNAHEELLNNRQTWLDDHDQLLSQPRRERFDYAQKLANNKESLRQVLNAWLSLWRDIILKASGAHMSITNIDREEQIHDFAQRIGLQRARRIAASIQHTTDLIDRNANTRLAVEVLLLDLPYI